MRSTSAVRLCQSEAAGSITGVGEGSCCAVFDNESFKAFGLITVTSSPAGLLYYYIKEAQMVLSDWCCPSVDSSWYVGVDTHYNPRVLLEEADFAQDSFRLLESLRHEPGGAASELDDHCN